MSADLGIVLLTLRVALVATLVVLPLGILAAWRLSRWRGPGRAVVETLLALPLVLPPTSVGLLLLELLRPGGWIGRVLARIPVDVLFTWKAAAIAAAAMAFPLMVRPARAAFEEIDPRLLSLARSLGCGPWAAFSRVALPLAWRGILAGAVLAFARAVGEFGATILIAGSIPGRTQTLALAIFHRAQIGDDAAALRLAAITVAIAFALLWSTELLLLRRGRRLRGGE